MDGFLLALIATFLAGWGEPSQLLTALCAAKRDRPAAALAGFAGAAAGICAIGAVGGGFIAGELSGRATLLMVGLALGYAGLIGLFKPAPPGRAARFRGGAFLTTAIFGAAFLSGGRAQLLVFALALWTQAPVLAAVGGTVGLIAASAPAALLGREFLTWRLRPVRLALAGAFLLAGFAVALAAF